MLMSIMPPTGFTILVKHTKYQVYSAKYGFFIISSFCHYESHQLKVIVVIDVIKDRR